MSLKSAILGFLSARPMTGYDLKKNMDRLLSHFWPANQSQIYRTLAEMEDEGLVRLTPIPRKEHLDTKLYTITEDGSSELFDWVTTPIGLQPHRDAFLLQVYFAAKYPDSYVLELLRRELKLLEERIDDYAQSYGKAKRQAANFSDPRSLFFSMVTLEERVRADQSRAEWLRDTIARIEKKAFRVPEINV